MHLGNGTISNELCTITAALSTAALVYAANRVRRNATRAQLAKAAIGAGIVFLAQMYDIPLFGAVTVHAIGAAFLTLLAGPALALLGMTAVIVVQALVLNDGGLLTIGANVLNMSVIGVTASYLMMAFVRTRLHGTPALFIGAAAVAAVSVFAAVAAMSIELALSGTTLAAALGLTMPAHASFAVWETLTTLVLVVAARYAGAVEPLEPVHASR
jgi:cobalt/nickel transport system permease protein